MPEFVINVSNIISSLCHSLLRLEPYTVCPFRCIYCYSRWYIEDSITVVYPRKFILDKFNAIVKRMYRKGLRYIPFRLSTLVDPFPPHEELYRFSEKLLRISIKYEYPLIINTKSILIAREPWINYITKLAEEKNILIQISIPILRGDVGRSLEPSAPPPSQRLSIAKKLSELGIPIALRISPFIPSFSPSSIEEIREVVDVFKEYGIKHVIFEGLRIESENLSWLIKVSSSNSIEMENYSIREVNGLKPIVRLSRRILEPIYRIYVELLTKNCITFATCKEGIFNLHTAEDCCGFYLLKNYVRRPTLWDVYRFTVSHAALEPQTILSHICKENKIICSNTLDEYPRELSKPLKYHEKKLQKILSNRNLLEHLTPTLTISNGKIYAKR